MSFYEAVESISDVDYDYTYPAGLDLKPGSELHDKLVKTVTERARVSSDFIKTRFDKWRELDRVLTAYIDLDQEEKDIVNDDYRKPVSIVVPLSYANLETLLTYQTAAFLDDPIFKYEGVEDADVPGAILLQHVIDKQNKQFKNALSLHTMWRDAIIYGVGPVVVEWDRIMGYKSATKKTGGFFNKLVEKFVNSAEDERILSVLFEGNTIYNIDPYNYLPDPNTPLHMIQKSEFQGWVDRDNRMSLLDEEQQETSPLFNVQYLKHIRQRQSTYFSGESSTGRFDMNQVSYQLNEPVTNTVDVIRMFVNLIPREWELGPRNYPEKWFFAVAADSVLIAAQPQGSEHNMYPIAVDCPNFDGHGLMPVSPLEITYGMNHATNWLWNSHVTNSRKILNDMLVIDPSIINYNDAASPKPGKLIRARRSAFGRSLKDAIFQLPVQDVTRNNLADIQLLKSLMDETTGTTDSVKGIRRHTSERVSATESSQTTNAALSRLEKYAKISGWQSYFDLARLFASNTKELMSQETVVKLSGEYAQQLQSEYGARPVVKPSDIDVYYDIIPHDGTIPGNSDTQAWIQLFQILASNPVVAAGADMLRIFKHIARGTGAKNVDDFILKQPVQGKVLPDEQVQQGVQAGNLVTPEQFASMGGAA